jgi:hypothetical protein
MRRKDFIDGFKKYSIRYLILKPNSIPVHELADLRGINNFIILGIYKLK